MNSTQIGFLLDFAALCDKYKPDFFYTTEDDGVHIVVDGAEVFCGYSINAESVKKAIS